MLNENEGLEEHILVYVLDKFLMLLLTKYRAAFSLPYLPKKKKEKEKATVPHKVGRKRHTEVGLCCGGSP